MPMGFVGTVAEFHDLDAFRENVRRSRRLGFVGASVIHPSQVAILNEEFRPSAEEVDHASRVVAAYDKALAEGVGAVTVDGKMIDVPVVERARLLLDREDGDRRPRSPDAGAEMRLKASTYPLYRRRPVSTAAMRPGLRGCEELAASRFAWFETGPSGAPHREGSP